MSERRSRVFFRVVANDPPTLDDFSPDSAHRPKFPHESDEQYHGRSVWRTPKMARRTAELLERRTGRQHFIAAVEVAAGGRIRAERFPGSSDHFNLIGAPEDCLARARTVRLESVD